MVFERHEWVLAVPCVHPWIRARLPVFRQTREKGTRVVAPVVCFAAVVFGCFMAVLWVIFAPSQSKAVGLNSLDRFLVRCVVVCIFVLAIYITVVSVLSNQVRLQVVALYLRASSLHLKVSLCVRVGNSHPVVACVTGRRG